MQSRTVSLTISSLFENPYSKLYGNQTIKNKSEYGNFSKAEWELITEEYSRFFCSLDVFDPGTTQLSIASQINYLLNSRKPSQEDIDYIHELVKEEAKQLGKYRIEDVRQRLFLKHLRSWRKSCYTGRKLFNSKKFIGDVILLLKLAEVMDDGNEFAHAIELYSKYLYPQIIERVWLNQYRPKKVNLAQDLVKLKEAVTFLFDIDANNNDIIDYLCGLELSIGKVRSDGACKPLSRYAKIIKQCQHLGEFNAK